MQRAEPRVAACEMEGCIHFASAQRSTIQLTATPRSLPACARSLPKVNPCVPIRSNVER